MKLACFTACRSALLALLTLAATAHADSLVNVEIKGGGLDILFSLPSETTLPDAAFNGQYNPGTVSGTVNGVLTPIDSVFVYQSSGVLGNTLDVTGTPQPLYLGLPALYYFTYPTMDSETFHFLTGTYSSFATFPLGGPSYTINVTPESSMATTPEPSSLLLLGTAIVSAAGLVPRRRRRT